MARTPPPTKPSPAEEIMGGCFAGRIRLLNRTITGLYDEALRPAGLTAGQLTTLSFIEKLGPVAPGGLAKQLNMDKSTLSRNLSRMERNGWITITQGDAGHTQLVQIRKKGATLIAQALPRWREAQAQAEQLLGTSGAAGVVGAFNHARSQVTDM